jgi:hypothetical protein
MTHEQAMQMANAEKKNRETGESAGKLGEFVEANPDKLRTIRFHIVRAVTKTKAPISHPTPDVPWSSLAHAKVVRESLPMLYGATQVSAGSHCLDDQWFRNLPKGLDANQHISEKRAKRFLSR